jgi:hypothetical protein
VTRISELIGLRKRKYYAVKDIFLFQQTGVVDGQAVGDFVATGHVPTFLVGLHAAGVDLSPDLFSRRVLHDGPGLELGPDETDQIFPDPDQGEHG